MTTFPTIILHSGMTNTLIVIIFGWRLLIKVDMGTNYFALDPSNQVYDSDMFSSSHLR